MRLARDKYFLRVLNERLIDETDTLEKISGSPHLLNAHKILTELIVSIQTTQRISEELLDKVSKLLYERVEIKPVISIADDRSSSIRKFSGEGSVWSLKIRPCLDSKDKDSFEMVYIEAIISLIEACQEGQLIIKQCRFCRHWYIPHKHEEQSLFCSSNCRNRFHYGRSKNKTFQCSYCKVEKPIEEYSGLTKIDGGRNYKFGTFKDKTAICIDCANERVDGYKEYDVYAPFK